MCGTRGEKEAKPLSRSAIGVSRFFPQSPNRSCTPRSNIHATEPTDPKDRDRIDWKLITDLTVRSREEAIEKLRWYGLRWKIETFHKILKSGCKAEGARLRAAERIVNLLAILCLLSWRIFWITMLNRAIPEAAPELAFTPQEIYLLDQLVSDTAKTAAMGNGLSLYLGSRDLE